METTVANRLQNIKASLPLHVTLIAVSKTKPIESILEAYTSGHRDFGENYVQELVDKYAQLPKDIRWHFIGHLQSNKAKYIVPFTHLIHGIDSLSLLKEVNKQALKNNKIQDCLLQVHIAKEETKFGFDASELEDPATLNTLATFSNIRIRGLMAMASNTNDTEHLKAEFTGLKTLFNILKTHAIPNLNMEILSCGMSSDYPLAIAHGSTMIRIGSSIFGEREYKH
ncbi:MAG: YggS family pyridoxal phosphate-dependent enzyme [Sediminibacterium sp.]|nr:YggS family pyridoxal phosphate-dependent enzyme [Sediminibacterium sp.]